MNVLSDVNYELIMDRFQSSAAELTFSIIIGYLLTIYLIGPRLMKDRPAFQLKYFMSAYNVMQVIICFYMTDYIWAISSWDIFNFAKCVNYLPNTPELKAFDDLTFKLFLLKTFELVDTVIFVLRKKQNQITYLHVFHHSSALTLSFMLIKYYKGNGALLSIYLNSWVHVIMYSYYFFANICSAETMKKFILIKKSITITQMAQFCAILTHAGFSWAYCEVHMFVKVYYCLVVSVIFYGFYDFYKKAYLSNQEKILKNKAK